MRGNKNLEVLLQIVILVCMALFLINNLLTGKINYYVHPRYQTGIWFSAIILLIFAVSLVKELKKGRHNSNGKKYVIYFMPIAFALLFPVLEGGNANKVIAQASQPGNVKESTSESTSINTSENNTIVKEELTQEDIASEDTIPNTSADFLGEEPEDKSLKYSGEEVEGVIRITDEFYSGWYYDLFDYLEDFKGKRYQFLAQVYSLEGLGENEFLAGRYIMVCCATDLTGYGIICKSDLRKDLKENEWILVTGTIGEYDYEGTKVPYLLDPVIEKTDAPEEEYVYYNFY